MQRQALPLECFRGGSSTVQDSKDTFYASGEQWSQQIRTADGGTVVDFLFVELIANVSLPVSVAFICVLSCYDIKIQYRSPRSFSTLNTFALIFLLP